LFVVSLICGGKLRKTALKEKDEDAVKVAQEWYGKYKEKYKRDGYVAIDYSVTGKTENIRFAELKFDRSGNELKLYLVGNHKKPIYFKEWAKEFLLCFLKYAVYRIADYFKEMEKKEK
jgi:hypothetical protein